MTTTSELRQITVEALKGKTAAGNNVFSARTWPTWNGNYPILYLHSPVEEKESLGPNTPQFTVTATIRISARIQLKALPNNGAAALAILSLETIQRQIEMVLINFPPLMERLQQFPFIRSEMNEGSEAEQLPAELVMDVGMEFYQGPEDFYPLEGPEDPGPPFDPAAIVAAVQPIVLLDEMDVSNDLTNVVDKTGTYAGPPFPGAVNPAPRTSGPDGRVEGTLTFEDLQE